MSQVRRRRKIEDCKPMPCGVRDFLHIVPESIIDIEYGSRTCAKRQGTAAEDCIGHTTGWQNPSDGNKAKARSNST